MKVCRRCGCNYAPQTALTCSGHTTGVHEWEDVKHTTVSRDQVYDVLMAMVLARFEVRLTFDPLALDFPYTCHTYKVAHGESEAPWSHGGHGATLGQAIRRSWDAIQKNCEAEEARG